MKEIEINKENLSLFINDIRKEDLEELKFETGENYKKEFIKTAIKFKKSSYFLSDNNNNPIAIGGYVPVEFNSKSAVIWLLVTNKAKYHKFELAKYINKKLNIFKNKFDVLFNYIYKSNFQILAYLKKEGFKVKNLKNKKYKLFYFNKEKGK